MTLTDFEFYFFASSYWSSSCVSRLFHIPVSFSCKWSPLSFQFPSGDLFYVNTKTDVSSALLLRLNKLIMVLVLIYFLLYYIPNGIFKIPLLLLNDSSQNIPPFSVLTRFLFLLFRLGFSFFLFLFYLFALVLHMLY